MVLFNKRLHSACWNFDSRWLMTQTLQYIVVEHNLSKTVFHEIIYEKCFILRYSCKVITEKVTTKSQRDEKMKKR